MKILVGENDVTAQVLSIHPRHRFETLVEYAKESGGKIVIDLEQGNTQEDNPENTGNDG